MCDVFCRFMGVDQRFIKVKERKGLWVKTRSRRLRHKPLELDTVEALHLLPGIIASFLVLMNLHPKP